jgi:hypothetical protein
LGGVSPASIAVTTWQLIKTIISASIPSVFSDVSLLVQKTGATTLPVGHQSTKHDGDGKGRQATIGRRSRQITPRNLYKVRPEGMLDAKPTADLERRHHQFVKVLEWHVSSGAIFSNGM